MTQFSDSVIHIFLKHIDDSDILSTFLGSAVCPSTIIMLLQHGARLTKSTAAHNRVWDVIGKLAKLPSEPATMSGAVVRLVELMNLAHE